MATIIKSSSHILVVPVEELLEKYGLRLEKGETVSNVHMEENDKGDVMVQIDFEQDTEEEVA